MKDETVSLEVAIEMVLRDGPTFETIAGLCNMAVEADRLARLGQEPVGEARQMSEFVEGFTHCIWDARVIPVGTKLYTTPPQRPWVGLTPQERDEINQQVYGAVPHHVAFHHAIEAKLRSKNG